MNGIRDTGMESFARDGVCCGSARRRRCLAACAGLLLVLGSTACHKKPKPQPPPPAQTQPQSKQPAPTPPPEKAPTITLSPPPNPAPPVLAPGALPAVPKSLAEGNVKMAGGDYRGATQDFERFLRDHPDHPDRPEVMFRLGVAYALAGQTATLQRMASDVFKSIMKLYPDSPYSMEAAFILKLQAEADRLKSEAEAQDEKIKRLREELERIKKIDIERTPPKPPL